MRFRGGRPTPLLIAGCLAACGGTSGLILGEAPDLDATAPETSGGPTDAGSGSSDVGCPGCTIPVGLSGSSETAQQGGTTGTPYTDTCPSGQAVVGFEGFLTAPDVGLTLVGGIQGVCGELFLSRSSNQIETGPGATLPIRGTSITSPWTQMCPANEIVVGVVGRSGADLDRASFECAPWLAPGDGGEALAMGAVVALAFAGGDGGSPYQTACPNGQLTVGSNVRAGDWVDAFGLVCATPALALDGGLD